MSDYSQEETRNWKPSLQGFMSSYPVSDFYIFCTISIWEFIRTLDEPMVRKLSIRSFRRGTGSMDYIYGFLKMEDDLDMDDGGPSAVSHDTPA